MVPSFRENNFQKQLRVAHPDFIRNYFDLPENRKLVCGISFGYADTDHPINSYRTERVTVEEMARWEE